MGVLPGLIILFLSNIGEINRVFISVDFPVLGLTGDLDCRAPFNLIIDGLGDSLE